MTTLHIPARAWFLVVVLLAVLLLSFQSGTVKIVERYKTVTRTPERFSFSLEDVQAQELAERRPGGAFKPSALPSILTTKNSIYTIQTNSSQLTLLLTPDPYPEQRGGSCTGHAIAQCIRYTLWRYSCNTRAACMSFTPEKPCPYYIWWLARCLWKQKCTSNTGVQIGGTLTQVMFNGWIWKGKWQVDRTIEGFKLESKRDIGDMKNPWKYQPPEDVKKSAEKIRQQYLLVPYKVISVGVGDFVKVLASGHAIVIGVKVGKEHLRTRYKTVGNEILEVFDDFVGPRKSAHAMVIMGYKFVGNTIFYQFLNSWGANKDYRYMSQKQFLIRGGYGYTLTWN
jgi:hypothetical protein